MTKLAIKGGKPTISEGLKIKWPVFDDSDRKALIDVLESGQWCSLGGFGFDSKVAQFERKFAKWIGTKYAISTNNGTSALVVAVKAGGIEAGDEVIVPGYTFLHRLHRLFMRGQYLCLLR